MLCSYFGVFLCVTVECTAGQDTPTDTTAGAEVQADGDFLPTDTLGPDLGIGGGPCPGTVINLSIMEEADITDASVTPSF